MDVDAGILDADVTITDAAVAAVPTVAAAPTVAAVPTTAVAATAAAAATVDAAAQCRLMMEAAAAITN